MSDPKELPAQWSNVRLADLVDVLDGKRVPLNGSQRATMKGEFPYYGANGLVDHINDYIFDGHYVLLAEDGGNFDKPERGVAYEATGKFWVNNHAHILSPKEGITPRFLRHWLNAIDWMPFISGTTRAKLTQGVMNDVPLPIPPAAEQRRIVARLDGLLGRTARARMELDRVPALIEKYKRALLAAMFQRNIPLRRLSGLVASTFYGPRIAKESYVAEGIPTLRTTDISDWGRLDPRNPPQVSVSKAEFQKWGLEDGDLIVTRTGATIGKCAVYEDLFGPALPSAYLIRVRLDSQLIVPKFALFFLLSPLGQEQLLAGRTAVAQPNINANAILSVQLPLPPLADQWSIVARIESAFAWLDKLAPEHTRAAALLPKLEQALLAKAFRGELMPQDPNDEPASGLLERIRAAAPERKRKPRSSNLPRAPRQRAAMTKSRLDQDVMHQPYLAKHLRDAGGSAKVEDLFRSADLPVTDFYKQLAWEVEAGHVNDRGALLEAA